MDITTLVQQVTPWLVYTAPYLWKLAGLAGEEATKEVAKEATAKISDEVWDGAKSVWNKILGSQSEIKTDVIKAVRDVAEVPDDADTHAALRVQLKKLLSADEELKEAISEVVTAVQTKQGNLDVKGTRIIQTGGHITNSTIITGDENIVGNDNRVFKNEK